MEGLKKISPESIPTALEKALRYRLLNEPMQAESICRDILAIDPENQEALITLLLSLTDHFGTHFTKSLDDAKQVLPHLKGDYERAYYEGIIYERWANAQLASHLPGDVAYGWYREAMRCYDRAQDATPDNDPDAALRWNTCARILQQQQVAPRSEGMSRDIHSGTDDVPIR